MRIEYQAFAFRQQESSPIEVAFVAYALDILAWAGVPRKSDEMLTGYQRFLDTDRINQEIVPYFQEPRNCSPTAIIVALRKDSGLGGCLLENSNIVAGQDPVATTLIIEVDEEALKTEKVFEAALRYVNSRLARSGTQAESWPAEEDADESFSDDEVEEEGEEEGESESEGEEFVHLGSNTLRSLKEMLDNKSYWVSEEFRDAIADYVKPALLIDGQHRVHAAARIGSRGLPFIICGLYDPDWEEQVFQFTVVNLKPRRISPSVITSIAALSLTRFEQDRVETRLTQAGVKMAEVTVMSLVAYDDKSPFASMIEMHVGNPATRADRLGYGAMKRIAKVWYRGNRKSLTLIAKNLFATNNISNARMQWHTTRAWFDFFCFFWDEVRRHFPESLWEKSPNNRLLIGANLWALQEAILTNADAQGPSYWKIPDEDASYEERMNQLKGRFLEIVSEALNCFPPELWTRPWAKTSQDTNAGRKDLVELFKKFIEEGQKSGFWKAWKNNEWFKMPVK